LPLTSAAELIALAYAGRGNAAARQPMTSSTRPSLRFYHSAALRARTNRLLKAIEEDEDPRRHASALAGLVLDLTDAGLDYFFLRPLEQAKISYVSRQMAKMGLAGALRVVSPIIRTILANADAGQMRVFARHIRSLM
jgi:hypothetical protein